MGVGAFARRVVLHYDKTPCLVCQEATIKLIRLAVARRRLPRTPVQGNVSCQHGISYGHFMDILPDG